VNEHRARLRDAARELVRLHKQFPELFVRVLPINDEDMQTLRELAELDDEGHDHATE
jgi:hypothetical protein